MDKILEILTEARPDVDFENESELFDQGILDSFDIVTIISDLNDAFEINIRVHDLTGENFNSLESIQALIERKKNE
jgi:D-alanine--poly(phosphoribitol) ligase subunit 2